MALRLVNKINRQFINKVCRYMSVHKEAPNIEPKQEEVKPKMNENLPPLEQYQVCRPRTTPVLRYHNEPQNEADAAKQYAAMQHLQPALLPEYYKSPLEIHTCIYPEPLSESDKQSSQIRRFEESKTCMNVTLPLKTPKLASPFPSPVKVMESHTISDQEKAEQMLAEAKVCSKGMSSEQRRQQQQQTVKSLPPYRSFATNSQKDCPKLGNGGVGGKGGKRGMCPHMKLPHCSEVKSISCKRKKTRPECKKKEAPYPSYSESCYEEVIEKPSECKMCPWKPEEHPTFKPPKQNFHTSSAFCLPSKKDECKKSEKDRKSICDLQTSDKDEKEKEQDKNAEQGKTKPQNKAYAVLIAPVALQGKQTCAKKKKPCDSPESDCHKKQRQKEQTKKQQSQQEKKKRPEAPKKLDGLTEDMGLWLDNLQAEAVASAPNFLVSHNAINFDSATVEDKNPCKKFPFKRIKEEDFPLEKNRSNRVKLPDEMVKCPKKKKRHLIKDCPPEDTSKNMTSINLNLLSAVEFLANNRQGKDDKKCPLVELGVCKEKGVEDDDPCNRKRKGKTLICPTNLLEKKRKKPRKKTCGITSHLVLSSSEPILTSTRSS